MIIKLVEYEIICAEYMYNLQLHLGEITKTLLQSNEK